MATCRAVGVKGETRDKDEDADDDVVEVTGKSSKDNEATKRRASEGAGVKNTSGSKKSKKDRASAKGGEDVDDTHQNGWCWGDGCRRHRLVERNLVGRHLL